MTTNASLLINGAHGIYIPQFFAQNYEKYVTNPEEIEDELKDLKSGPDNEFYWDSWATVMDNAKLKDDNGRECSLWQDGDLWAIPVDELEQIPEN